MLTTTGNVLYFYLSMYLSIYLSIFRVGFESTTFYFLGTLSAIELSGRMLHVPQTVIVYTIKWTRRLKVMARLILLGQLKTKSKVREKEYSSLQKVASLLFFNKKSFYSNLFLTVTTNSLPNVQTWWDRMGKTHTVTNYRLL